jgi:hypothetical protein
MPPSKPANSPNYAMMGFLAAAIAVLGMVGVMATYIAPLQLERAMLREAVLDDAEAALAAPNPQQALEALRPRLGESAEALLRKDKAAPEATPQIIAARITTERAAMRSRMLAESQGAAARLRIMILVCAVMTMGFGAMAVHSAGKR